MTDSELDRTTDSSDETEDCENTELETLARDGDWEEETFRDAGEATFGGS